MALGAKQGLPSSSKSPGPEGCTDWSTDEDGDPADVPVVGHDSPLLMCPVLTRSHGLDSSVCVCPVLTRCQGSHLCVCVCVCVCLPSVDKIPQTLVRK